MPYEKTTWKSGDVISTARLNKIEQGIEDAENGALPAVTAEDDGKVLGVENGEWGAVSISTAPPDWNAKEGEDGYIENRPFYDGRELELVCEFEGELDQQVVSFSPIPIDDKYLNYDNDYIVDINGVIEENFKYQTRPYIGSHFFSADSGNYILIDTTSTPKTTHTFWADPKYAETISHYNVKLYLLNGGEIHTINSIYLPEGAILKNIRDGVTRSVEEGGNSIASGYQAHAEGSYTTASGDISHAEGEYTTASGIHSHAEGQYTTASSGDSHAEGFRTTASGYQAHAEGDDTISSGMCSHAEGKYTTAFGDSSHAEGHFGYAKGEASHVEGGKIQEAVKIRLSGDANARTYNVIEQPYGTLTLIGRYIGYSSNYVRVVSETKNNSGTIVSITVDKTLSETAITNQYYPLEVCSVATGISSHAEGANTTAANNFAHSEGYGSYASGIAAHAEGDHTSASGYDSHAEGCVTVASGREAHAEGIGSKASGDESHAEGSYTTASGNFSHAEGQGTVANHVSQHVFGQYNIADPSSATNNNRGDYVEIVGNGTSNQAQSNARTLDWSGNEVLAGNLTLGMGANAATLTPEKINQIGQGGGADWNAKQGSSSYIANKPFYDDRELGTIWQVEGLYFSDGSCYPPSNTIFEPTLDTNASYYVEVEGVKIDNLTYDMENGRIGNRLFGLTVQGGKLTSVIDNSGVISDGTHTLSLGIYEGNLVKIDEKYLPDDIRLLNIRDGEGTGAIAEGTNTKANGSHSHAEGINTTSFGMAAHAEGYFTQASGIYAHAEGSNTVAGEMNSHAEGLNTSALADNSHAEGWSTIANHKSQHVFGEYNVADGSTSASKRGNYVEIVGNGTSGSARSNARTLDWDGNETLAGKLTVGSDPTENMDVATKQYVDNGLSGKADSSTLSSKVNKPATSPDGTSGQFLKTNGDGTTQWAAVSTATDAQVTTAVNSWMTNHPEATTTVQDGAINYAKLDTSLKGTVDDVSSLKSDLEQISEVIGSETVDVYGYTPVELGLVNYTSLNHGVTFTQSSDGTVTAVGTNNYTAGIIYGLRNSSSAELTLSLNAGDKYRLSGCPSGGGSSTYGVSIRYASGGGALFRDYGSGVIFDIPETTTYKIHVLVAVGMTIDKTFTPKLEKMTVIGQKTINVLTAKDNVAREDNANLSQTLSEITEEGVSYVPIPFILKPLTATQQGITFVQNTNGTIDVSGTNTDSAGCIFSIRNNDGYIAFELEAGKKYLLSGCPADGSATTYRLDLRLMSGGGALFIDTGEGVICEITQTDSYKVNVAITSGVTVDTTFKPKVSEIVQIDGTSAIDIMARQTLNFSKTANVGNVLTATEEGAAWKIPVAIDSNYDTPLNYGAVGDGVTDDTLAFESMENNTTKSIIYIPKGVYNINGYHTTKSIVMDEEAWLTTTVDKATVIYIDGNDNVYRLNIRTKDTYARYGVRVTGDNNYFKSIIVDGLNYDGVTLYPNNTINAGVGISGNKNTFETIKINDFVQDYSGNDSAPQGVAFANSDCTENYIANFSADNCRAGIVNAGNAGTVNAIGVIRTNNCGDNTLYCVGGGHTDVGTIIMSNATDEGIVCITDGADGDTPLSEKSTVSIGTVIYSDCILGRAFRFKNGGNMTVGDAIFHNCHVQSMFAIDYGNYVTNEIIVDNIVFDGTLGEAFNLSSSNGDVDKLCIRNLSIKDNHKKVRHDLINDKTYFNLTSVKRVIIDSLEMELVDTDSVYTGNSIVMNFQLNNSLTKSNIGNITLITPSNVQSARIDIINAIQSGTVVKHGLFQYNNSQNILSIYDGDLYNKLIFSSAKPNYGTWTVGDMIMKTDGSELYICTASGTPGTWKTIT